MTVAAATPSDTKALAFLRDEAADWLLAQGINQWHSGERPVSWDQPGHELFVLRHGPDIAGTVTILWEDPFIWGEQPGAAGYIHNLVVARPYSGQSLGRRLLQWAEDHIASSGRSVARLDCAKANLKLRELYESVGYHWVRDELFPELGADRGVALYEKTVMASPTPTHASDSQR